MSESASSVSYHAALLHRLAAQVDPLQAAFRLSAIGWKVLYGQRQSLSWVMGDPSGDWVIKCNLMPDPAYECFAHMLTEPGVFSPHLPKVAAFAEIKGQGSLTLMERLQPIEGEHMPKLWRLRTNLIAGAKVQEAHMNGTSPQLYGSLPAVSRASGLQSESLLQLATFLGYVAHLANTDLVEWQPEEVMRRADGTEVLLDPFERLPRAYVR